MTALVWTAALAAATGYARSIKSDAACGKALNSRLAERLSKPGLEATLAQHVVARGRVARGDGEAAAMLVMCDDLAVYVERGATGQVDAIILREPEQVLSLLADRRRTFLWAALSGWAGPGLESFRARRLAQSETAYSAGRPSAGGERLTAFYPRRAVATADRADTLAAFGQREAAAALLREALSAALAKRESLDSALLANRLAADLKLIAPERLAALDTEVEAAIGGSLAFANYAANRAYQLAEAGDAAAAQAMFGRTQVTGILSALTRLSSADAALIPVQACILAKSNRPAEAEALLATLPVSGKLAANNQDTAEMRVSAATCMADEAAASTGIAAMLADGGPPSTMLMLVQPNYRGETAAERAIVHGLQRDRALAPLISRYVRALDESYTAALNGWSAS